MADFLERELLDKAFKFAIEEVYLEKITQKPPQGINIEISKWRTSWRLVRNGLLDYTLINNLMADRYSLVAIWDQGTAGTSGTTKGERKSYIITPRKPDGWLRFPKPTKPRASKPTKLPGNRAFEKDGFIFAKKVLHPGIRSRHNITQLLRDKATFRLFERMMENYIKRRMALMQ